MLHAAVHSGSRLLTPSSFVHLLLFQIALLQHSLYTVNCTYLKCTLWYVLAYMYNHKTVITIKTPNTSIIPKVSLCHFETPTSCPFPVPQIYFALSKVLHRYHHMIYTLWSNSFHSAYFFYPFIQLYVSIAQSVFPTQPPKTSNPTMKLRFGSRKVFHV